MYLQTEWDQRIKIWLEELEREALEWFDNCYNVRSE